MSVKSKKSGTLWLKCETCQSVINQKDLEIHSTYCPPSQTNFFHPYITNEILHSCIGIKTNEEIKGISSHDKNNLIFLSQSAIQICDFVIGDWVRLESSNQSCARIVWPTNEKSISSVLITQSDFDLNWSGKNDSKVAVSKLNVQHVPIAREIKLLPLNAPKSLHINPELILRIKNLHINRIVTNDNNIELFFYGKNLKFQIKDILSDNGNRTMNSDKENLENCFNSLNINGSFFKITESTTFNIPAESDVVHNEKEDNLNPLLLIGGLNDEISEIKNLVDIALGKISKIRGTKCSRGILLYGASGTGKTMIANAISKTSNCNIISINGTEIYSKYSGETETGIKSLFKEAIDRSPSIILIDEMDILCPLRTSRITDQEKRVISTLLSQIDELNKKVDSKVCILATTNKLDGIDSAFRRAGRLDREVEIPIPNPKYRFEILKKLLNNVNCFIEDSALKEIANSAYGFVGSDLQSLISCAEIHAIKRSCDTIELQDLVFALTRVRPSAMREVQIEVPNVKWSDIGGQDKLKLILKQAVEWPLKHPESFIRMGITSPKGILMFGPPGCSKTMIAKALATESGLNFLSIKGPELFSKWVGESERAVREVFRKARQVAPSVVFFDEIDALGGERTSGSSSGGTSVQERVLAQLLTELDGITPLGDVTILAATNRPDRIDKALLRPGRLDRMVYVPLPNKETRAEIFKIKLRKMPVKDVDLNYLVDRTVDYSGAEIQAVCHEAAMKALEYDINATIVSTDHFEEALNIITPRTPQSLIRIYEEYVKK